MSVDFPGDLAVESAAGGSMVDRSPSLTRREAFHRFFAFAAASPLLAQGPSVWPDLPEVTYLPDYGGEVMDPVNVHEMEDAARKKVNKLVYDFIAGGAEDELTIRANREAYSHFWLRRRVMVDVSRIDTSVELLGKKLPFPILLCPTGGKNLVIRNGDRMAAEAAFASNALYTVSPQEWMQELADDGKAPLWWANSIGFSTKDEAQAFARRSEDFGTSGFAITMDYPYTPNRDRNNRNRFDYGYLGSGLPANPKDYVPRQPAIAAKLEPHSPNMTFEVIEWLKGVSSLPVIIKGILRGDDASRAVAAGADALIVSNHGGRGEDGVVPTLEALPEVVQAVSGRIPVLIDGGIRRGSDALKALSLGARAVMIGRPYVFGLAAFGVEGVQRVIDLLRAELTVSMGLAGMPNLASIRPDLVRRAWEIPS
jgi:isopentenyl diphosphate isomerase/L-lactate dehydrogenase-like FMN-dependent dehydrogenase